MEKIGKMKWYDTFEDLVFLLQTLKGGQCCPVLDEWRLLIKHIGEHYYIEDITSVNVNIEMQKASKSRRYHMHNAITAVLTKPEQLSDIIDEIQEFVAYENYYYSICGTVAVVINGCMLIPHIEQECGSTIIEVPV